MDEDEAKAGAHAPSWEAEIAMEGREGKQEEAVEGSDAAPHDPEAVLGEVRGRTCTGLRPRRGC